MRIVIATPIYPPEIGGPATYTRELAARLAKGEQVTVVAYGDEGAAVEGTKLVLVSKKQPLLVRLVEYFFAVLHEARMANVIYVQNAVASGLPAALVGMILRKPVVLKFVGDEAWERAAGAGKTKKNLADFLQAPEGGLKTSIFLAIEKFTLAHVARVVPPSQFLADIISASHGVPLAKVIVNYNAFEGEAAPASARKPHQVLSVARLVSWKGIDGIMGALKIIKNTYPDATLVIAGEGPEERALVKHAADLGLVDSIEFRGRVSREGIAQLMSESAVSVLNSTYEGLPHIALESFAAGTPMIATDIPGTREAVINEKSGLLVPAGDDATLAVAIGRMFTEPELTERLVEGGRQLLKEKFSWEQHLSRLLAVFSAVQEN